MQWAVPGLFGFVPLHDATHVRSNGIESMWITLQIAAKGNMLAINFARFSIAIAEQTVTR